MYSEKILTKKLPPLKRENNLIATTIETPLGSMFALASDKVLYLLEFENRPFLQKKIEQLTLKTNMTLIFGSAEPLESIKNELQLYFNGQLKAFLTPYLLIGTSFQKSVWAELSKIPPGKTKSYQEIANHVGNERAYRAVAGANSRNPLAILVPCHRVINANGNLCGYAGGVDRKKWLLDHERKNSFIQN